MSNVNALGTSNVTLDGAYITMPEGHKALKPITNVDLKRQYENYGYYERAYEEVDLLGTRTGWQLNGTYSFTGSSSDSYSLNWLESGSSTYRAVNCYTYNTTTSVENPDFDDNEDEDDDNPRTIRESSPNQRCYTYSGSTTEKDYISISTHREFSFTVSGKNYTTKPDVTKEEYITSNSLSTSYRSQTLSEFDRFYTESDQHVKQNARTYSLTRENSTDISTDYTNITIESQSLDSNSEHWIYETLETYRHYNLVSTTRSTTSTEKNSYWRKITHHTSTTIPSDYRYIDDWTMFLTTTSKVQHMIPRQSNGSIKIIRKEVFAHIASPTTQQTIFGDFYNTEYGGTDDVYAYFSATSEGEFNIGSIIPENQNQLYGKFEAAPGFLLKPYYTYIYNADWYRTDNKNFVNPDESDSYILYKSINYTPNTDHNFEFRSMPLFTDHELSSWSQETTDADGETEYNEFAYGTLVTTEGSDGMHALFAVKSSSTDSDDKNKLVVYTNSRDFWTTDYAIYTVSDNAILTYTTRSASKSLTSSTTTEDTISNKELTFYKRHHAYNSNFITSCDYRAGADPYGCNESETFENSNEEKTLTHKEYGYNLTTTWQKLIFHNDFVHFSTDEIKTKLKDWPVSTTFGKSGIKEIDAKTLTASIFLSHYPVSLKNTWSVSFNKSEIYVDRLRTYVYGKSDKEVNGQSPPHYMWYDNTANIPTVLRLKSDSSHFQKMHMLGRIAYKNEQAELASYPHKVNALNEIYQCTISYLKTTKEKGEDVTKVSTSTFSDFIKTNHNHLNFTNQIVPYKAAKIAPNILYSYHSDKRNLIFYYNTFGSQVDRIYTTGGIALEGTHSMTIASSVYLAGFDPDSPVILEKTIIGEPPISSIIAYSDFTDNYNFNKSPSIQYDFTGSSSSRKTTGYDTVGTGTKQYLVPRTTSVSVFSTYAGIAQITERSSTDMSITTENVTGTYTREINGGKETTFGVHSDTIRRIVPYVSMPGTFNHEALFSMMTCVGFTKLHWTHSLSVKVITNRDRRVGESVRNKIWGKYFYHKPYDFRSFIPFAPKNWALAVDYKNNDWASKMYGYDMNAYGNRLPEYNLIYRADRYTAQKDLTKIGYYEWISDNESDVEIWKNFAKYFTFYGKNNAICTFLGRSDCPKSWDPKERKWKEWDLGFDNEPETGLFYYSNPILSYENSKKRTDKQTELYNSQIGNITFRQAHSSFSYLTDSSFETFTHGKHPVILSPQTIKSSTTSENINLYDIPATYYRDQENPYNHGSNISPLAVLDNKDDKYGAEIGAYVSFVRTSPAIEIAQIGTLHAKGAILDCIYEQNGMLYETPAATAFTSPNKYCKVADGDKDLEFEFNLLTPARRGDLKIFVEGAPIIGSIGIIKNGSGQSQQVVAAGEGSVVLLEPLEFDFNPEEGGVVLFGAEAIAEIGQEQERDARSEGLSNEEYNGTEDDIKSVYYPPPPLDKTNFINKQITNNKVNFGFESTQSPTKTIISIDEKGSLYKKEVNSDFRVTYKITNPKATKTKDSPLSEKLSTGTAILPITFTKQIPYTTIVNVNKTSSFSSVDKIYTETIKPQNSSDYSMTTSTLKSRRYFYLRSNTSIITSTTHNGDTHDLDTVFARVTTDATIADEQGDYTVGTYSNKYITLLRSDYNSAVINSPYTTISDIQDETFYLKNPDIISYTHTAFKEGTPTLATYTNVYRTVSGIEPYITTEYKTLFSSLSTFQPTASVSFKFQQFVNTFSESVYDCETETYLIPWGTSNETFTVHCSTKEIGEDEENIQKYEYFYNIYTKELHDVISDDRNIKSIEYSYNKFDTNGAKTSVGTYFTDFVNPQKNPFFEIESQFVGEWMLPEHFTLDGRVNPEKDFVLGISPIGGYLQ